jgi:YVTN family beta-propeller protein
MNKFFVIIISILATANVCFAITAPRLVVVNRGASTLSIIDPTEMKVLATVPTGSDPHEVVLTADGTTAIVSNYGAQTPGSSFSIIDIATRKETKRVDLLPLMRPHGLVEVGGKIYFTAEVNRTIGRFDLATNKVDWLMGTGQDASHMLALNADQKKIYTTNVASDSVTAFELTNIPPAQSKISQIAVGKQPEAIDISPNGKEVWVGLNVDAAIDVIDTASKKVVESIKLGERPYRVRFTPDGKFLVATMTNSKELIVIDTATRNHIRSESFFPKTPKSLSLPQTKEILR